ncbi:MAG: hypothetical protein QM781_18015 [Chitinophagaceae bacterium]
MRQFLVVAFLAAALNSFGQNNQSITVDLSGKTWLSEFKADKGIALSKLPSSITLVLPDTNFQGYKFRIGTDTFSKRFYVGLSCSGDTCINVQLNDIKDNKIVLHFTGGYLVGIGTRLLEPQRQITLEKDTLYMAIIPPVASKPGKPPLPSGATEQQNTDEDKGICELTKYPRQESLEGLSSFQMFYFLCSKVDTAKDGTHCYRTVASPFNYKFNIPCLNTRGAAVTHKYRLVYDVSDTYVPNGNPFTILKMKRKKGYEYYKVKKVMRPRAWREIVFSVIGAKDSIYKVSLTSNQNFMEYEKDFAEGLQKIATTAQKGGAADTTSASGNITDSVKPIDKKPLDRARELKQQMDDLKKDLNSFNNVVFPTVDFSMESYQYELQCLKDNISRIFNIPIPTSGKDLAKSLEDKVEVIGLTQYYQVFCAIIKQINAKYEEAINKKIRYYVVSDILRVPNEDEINISIKTKNGTDVLQERKYQVSGGFKIDFSTGFFHSGLSASDFVISSRQFRFKDTRDTILPTGADSVMYTGFIRDTSVSVIQKNKKLSFGTGIYIHFYPRTGGALNLGGAGGVIIDNNGQVQFLLGGSIMFKAGKNRVALVGGFARGKEKILSAENEQYYWRGSTSNSLLNSRHEVPQNFSGTNPATFDRWKSSWFVGLTFNFASVPAAK